MGQRDSCKKIIQQQSWEETPPIATKIAKWKDSAFHVVVEKLQENHGDAETVLRTGEAFGRGLYSQQLKEQSPVWTLEKWLELSEDDVFRPLDTEFTFTKISDDAAMTFLNRNPLKFKSKENAVEPLFTYGVMRGLFLSAFPDGELLFEDKETADHKKIIFKTHASVKDRFERERVKRLFTSLKPDDDA